MSKLQPISGRNLLLLYVSLVFSLCAFSVRASAQTGEAFPLTCALPFKSIQESREIDNKCGIEGKSTGTDKQHAQNRMKNNFCATGNPVNVTFDDLINLQLAAKTKGITFGSDDKLPEDRSLLTDLIKGSSGKKIGEGKKVRLVAFVDEAHYSNVQSGESVNCKRKGQENNDIHLVLLRLPSGTPCQSLTAEISPHFRPADWTPDNTHQIKRPFRFTGQLFFDAAHSPCPKPSGPSRASNWEIHPVYAIDVCKNKTLAGCDINDESNGFRCIKS